MAVIFLFTHPQLPMGCPSGFSVWLENIFVICNGQQLASSETTVWSKLFVWLFACLFVLLAIEEESIASGKNQFYLPVHQNIYTIYDRIYAVWKNLQYSQVNIFRTQPINDRLSGGQLFLSL